MCGHFCCDAEMSPDQRFCSLNIEFIDHMSIVFLYIGSI